MASKDKYTVILRLYALPTSSRLNLHSCVATYNERRNLPIITWLLHRTFTAK